jgi:phenylphosphate carboxylase alpha subunit
MSFSDIRQFIAALADSGDVIKISEEVDFDLELRAIACHSREMGGPIPFFEKIKGYPPGYRVFGPAEWSHNILATALGLGADISWHDLDNEIEQRLASPIKPVVVSTGPCKENILKGEEVDLFRFPAPLFAPGDGGRMIGTLCIQIIKDPDSDWVNWGTYRMMIHDKRHAGMFLKANQTGDMWREKFKPLQKPMPMAIAIGCDPYSHMGAAFHLPKGVSEVDYAGALKQEPVELVKCETNQLLVPATAEIILEGELLPDVELPEGPFCEWTCHETSFDWSPVFRVNAITHRHDPILTGMTVTLSPLETSFPHIFSLIHLKRVLRGTELPVVDIFSPPEAKGACLVVAVKRQGLYSNTPNQIANVVQSELPGQFHMLIVVDEDIDIYNLTEVFHALATRCHPGRGIILRNHDMANELLPYLTPQEKEDLRAGSVVFNCTWPVDWLPQDTPVRTAFHSLYSKELQEQIVNKWEKYGFQMRKEGP